MNNLNDKMRFIVLTFLFIVFFPLTLLIILVAWLVDILSEVIDDYVGLYKKAWRNN